MVRAISKVLLLCVRGVLALALFGVVANMGVVLLLRGGVDSSVPDFVRATELAELEAVMDAREVELVEASYSAPNGSGVRTFVGVPNQLEPGSELAHAFEHATALRIRGNGSEGAGGAVCAQEGWNGSACTGELGERCVQGGSLQEPLQAASAFVAGEYEALGVDIAGVRMRYLRSALSQLLGYLGLLAAVLFLSRGQQRAHVLK